MLPKRAADMTDADVEQLITDVVLEAETLDYKSDPAIRQPAEAAKRLDGIVARATSAFADSGGGVLVLGVDEGPKGEPLRSTPPGFPAMYGRERADEHIEKIITRCVVPRPAATVYQREIPNTGRVYLLVDIAPRGAGPHQVRNTSNSELDGRYYIRLGRESVVADHYQLRQLFAEALESASRVREYLQRYGFGDPDRDGFALKFPASLLAPRGEARIVQSAFLVTIVPEVLRGEVVDTDDEQIQRLLTRQNSPVGQLGYEAQPTLEGRMTVIAGTTPPLLESYFHVHRSGYVEAANSQVVKMVEGRPLVFAHAAVTVLGEALRGAAVVHRRAGTRDRVQVAVHIRGAMGTRLAVDPREPRPTEYVRPGLTIAATFPVELLGDARTVAFFDHRLAQAFGLKEGLMLNRDGTERPRPIFG